MSGGVIAKKSKEDPCNFSYKIVINSLLLFSTKNVVIFFNLVYLLPIYKLIKICFKNNFIKKKIVILGN